MSGRQRQGVLATLERLTGLTGQGLGLLVAAVAAVLLGRQLGSPGITILGYALGLVLLLVWVMARRRVAVEATRSSLPRRVTVGKEITAEVSVTADRRQSSVVLEEEFPHALWRHVRLTVPVLPARKETTCSYRFRADRRGTYTVGPLRLERTDPFGFVRSRQEIAPATSFVVHPRTEPVVDRILRREFEDPIIRPPHSRPWPTGAEFYGMRPYQHGDDPRRIVWRAVARADQLLVREAEHGITDTVTIMLDTSTTSFPGRGESASFERAVSVAASVGTHHLDSGFSVTLHTNAAQATSPLRGKKDRLELLDTLAAVERHRGQLSGTIERLLLRREPGGHHVVITSELTTESTASLRLLLDRGRSIVLVLVLDRKSDPLTFQHALGLRCPIVEVLPEDSLARPFQHAVAVRPR